ncbi:hypothetical protein J6590_012097 [Homalodisca vitripennis]|nr:hypothetical protein J6590_012097 [Homalodisca vitripennis]
MAEEVLKVAGRRGKESCGPGVSGSRGGSSSQSLVGHRRAGYSYILQPPAWPTVDEATELVVLSMERRVQVFVSDERLRGEVE